jgi:hypothetical protein
MPTWLREQIDASWNGHRTMAKLGDGRFKFGARVRQTGARVSRRPTKQRDLNETAVRRRGDPMSEENHEMAEQKATKTIPLGVDHKEPAPEFFEQRKRPENGQFRLQVDRQTKASYTTREAAEEAGLAIKKTYPILHVVVHDAAEGVHQTIELPK